jgi:hypothetical protein
MNTGENEQGLRSIIDLVRKASVVLLALHFIVFCYVAFKEWGLTHPVMEKILMSIGSSGIFRSPMITKLLALALLALSLVGARGKKDEKITPQQVVVYLSLGLLFYFSSVLFFYLSIPPIPLAATYMTITATGFLLIMGGGAKLSRLIKVKLKKDVFNEENQTFPQEERLLENEYSVNLPGKYHHQGKVKKMWLNLINGARMCLILGSPGAGKTYFLVRHIIKQKLERRQFPGMLLYDFKYDDLARIAYNSWLKSRTLFKVPPAFYIINFDNPINRCNPLEPATMRDITDATESSRTILLGLNMEWIKKTGDFFVESPINFLTAIIWFLKKYKQGKYCTLPHAIELMQMDYNDLFPVLSTEHEIEVLIG